MSKIATTKMKLQYIPNGSWIPETPSKATITVVEDKKVAASGAALIFGISTAPKACVLPGAVLTVGIGNLSAGAATRLRSQKQAVMIDSDEGKCNGVFTLANGTTTACNCKIKIIDAGQQKVHTK